MKKTLLITSIVLLIVLVFVTTASAESHFRTTIGGGTPNPQRLNKPGYQIITVDNIGDEVIEEVKLEAYSPTPGQGFRVMKITVWLNGEVICSDKVYVDCYIGDFFPGDQIQSKVKFQGKEPGTFELIYWFTHDGWVTPYNTGLTFE